MIKLLSIVSIIFAIVLFPPATLALVSNNAIPGDATYPIKRKLEDVIYAAASLNPTTQAWFSAARSDRRFKEYSTLIAQGKSASNTLVELVSQTDVAAEEIKKIDDPVKKEQLIAQLSQSIEKYDQGLKQIAQQTPASVVAPVASSSETPQPTATPNTQITMTPPAPVSTSKPVNTPTPEPSFVPTKTSLPSPTLTPSPTPGHTTEGSGDQQQEVNDAIDKLKKIKDKLKNETKSNTIQPDKHEEKPQQNEIDSKDQKGTERTQPNGEIHATKNEKQNK